MPLETQLCCWGFVLKYDMTYRPFAMGGVNKLFVAAILEHEWGCGNEEIVQQGCIFLGLEQATCIQVAK
jgi:hypothetical protein